MEHCCCITLGIDSDLLGVHLGYLMLHDVKYHSLTSCLNLRELSIALQNKLFFRGMGGQEIHA